MANARGDAVITEDTICGVMFYLSSTLTDPDEVRQVEILDTDGTTVLETIASGSISNPSTGKYTVTAAGANLDAAGVYYDKWYYTLTDGASEQTVTQDFYVSTSGGGAGALTGAEIISEVESNLGGRSDLTARVADWLQMAVTEIYQEVDFQGAESTASFTTEADEDEYALSSITDDSTYDIHEVTRMELDDGANSRPITIRDMPYCIDAYRNPADHTDRPRDAFIWANVIYLRPMPDAEYTINLWTRYIPPTVASGDSFVLTGLDPVLVALTTSHGYDALKEYDAGGHWRKKAEWLLKRARKGEAKHRVLQLQPFSVGRAWHQRPTQANPWYGID